MSESAGSRLKKLRIALGFKKRPAFSEIFDCTPARIEAIERDTARQKMNEDDFRVIAEKWPWALHYIAAGGELVIPDDVDAPVKVVSDMAATSNAAPASIDPAELMKALTTDPAMKAAFQKMMVEILQQGLNSDGN